MCTDAASERPRTEAGPSGRTTVCAEAAPGAGGPMAAASRPGSEKKAPRTTAAARFITGLTREAADLRKLFVQDDSAAAEQPRALCVARHAEKRIGSFHQDFGERPAGAVPVVHLGRAGHPDVA